MLVLSLPAIAATVVKHSVETPRLIHCHSELAKTFKLWLKNPSAELLNDFRFGC